MPLGGMPLLAREAPRPMPLSFQTESLSQQVLRVQEYLVKVALCGRVCGRHTLSFLPAVSHADDVLIDIVFNVSTFVPRCRIAFDWIH